MSSWKTKQGNKNKFDHRSSIPLEFTTTAINRPQTLFQTYSSLVKNFRGVDFGRSVLYINIDPVPNSDKIELVEQVAKQFFGTVITNITEIGSAEKANHWCFTQVKGEYFFNIEDDWVLTREINLHNMINQMNRHHDRMQLYLMGSQIKEGRPTLIPSLMRTQALQKFIKLLNFETNYEQQMISIYNQIGQLPLSMQYGQHKYFYDIGRVPDRKDKQTDTKVQ